MLEKLMYIVTCSYMVTKLGFNPTSETVCRFEVVEDVVLNHMSELSGKRCHECNVRIDCAIGYANELLFHSMYTN